MTPERLRQVKALFEEAVELQGDARRAYLARVCAEDSELRREVEEWKKLLEADPEIGKALLLAVIIEERGKLWQNETLHHSSTAAEPIKSGDP